MTKRDIKNLQLFQKIPLNWLTGKKISEYATQLWKQNLLPLTTFMQLNIFRQLRKLRSRKNSFDLAEVVEAKKRDFGLFNLEESRTETTSGEFCIR